METVEGVREESGRKARGGSRRKGKRGQQIFVGKQNSEKSAGAEPQPSAVAQGKDNVKSEDIVPELGSKVENQMRAEDGGTQNAVAVDRKNEAVGQEEKNKKRRNKRFKGKRNGGKPESVPVVPLAIEAEKTGNPDPHLIDLGNKLASCLKLVPGATRDGGPAPIRKPNGFEVFNLRPELLAGISELGWKKLAGIQERALEPCIKGRDIIMQAQSGMGKTAVFVISILQRLDLENPKCQAIVLAPTRELAKQIKKDFAGVGRLLKFVCLCCNGGENMKQNLKGLQGKNMQQVVVGTPGRIAHLMRGPLDGNSIKTLVMDEADTVLPVRFGFANDINYVFGKISEEAQIILSSATIPPSVLELTTFMHNPKKFLINNSELTLEGIRQYYISVENDDEKFMTLMDIFMLITSHGGMVFCNSKLKVKDIRNKLAIQGKDVLTMDSNLDQSTRNDIMSRFRGAQNRMIVTTDVLARGIDVQTTKYVINYDIPELLDNYIHRVGRAGRFGRRGIAISFADKTDQRTKKLETLQSYYNTEIVEITSVDELEAIINTQM